MSRTPRERLVYTAVQHLRAHGVAGTSLRPLVADAGAPWGSLSHYFPDGKDQVVCEALAWAGDFAATGVCDYLGSADPATAAGLWQAMVDWWIEDLRRCDFAYGCPVAAAIADSAQGSEPIRVAAADALQAWRAPIRAGLIDLGLPRKDAGEVATVLLAALEGGIVLARAQRSTKPLRVLRRRMLPMVTR